MHTGGTGIGKQVQEIFALTHLAQHFTGNAVIEEQIMKTRERQKGKAQYQKLSEKGDYFEVKEFNARFWVNLTDYLDTGLFLDHRIARKMLGQMSQGKDFPLRRRFRSAHSR